MLTEEAFLGGSPHERFSDRERVSQERVSREKISFENASTEKVSKERVSREEVSRKRVPREKVSREGSLGEGFREKVSRELKYKSSEARRWTAFICIESVRSERSLAPLWPACKSSQHS